MRQLDLQHTLRDAGLTVGDPHREQHQRVVEQAGLRGEQEPLQASSALAARRAPRPPRGSADGSRAGRRARGGSAAQSAGAPMSQAVMTGVRRCGSRHPHPLVGAARAPRARQADVPRSRRSRAGSGPAPRRPKVAPLPTAVSRSAWANRSPVRTEEWTLSAKSTCRRASPLPLSRARNSSTSRSPCIARSASPDVPKRRGDVGRGEGGAEVRSQAGHVVPGGPERRAEAEHRHAARALRQAARLVTRQRAQGLVAPEQATGSSRPRTLRAARRRSGRRARWRRSGRR